MASDSELTADWSLETSRTFTFPALSFVPRSARRLPRGRDDWLSRREPSSVRAPIPFSHRHALRHYPARLDSPGTFVTATISRGRACHIVRRLVISGISQMAASPQITGGAKSSAWEVIATLAATD